MMSNQRSLLLGALALMCQPVFSETPAQQSRSNHAQQDQTVRLKTDLLEVRAVVTHKGQVIENLKKEDFELLEDGHPQTISFFALEQIGAARGARLPSGKIEALEASRTAQLQPRKQARTIVIFVDNLHITLEQEALLRVV